MAGYGMDHWTTEQVEGQIDNLNRDLELLEFEKREVLKRERMLLDAKANAEAELADRYRAANGDEKVYYGEDK